MWDDVKTQPKFRFYKFQSLKLRENACKLGEIMFTGVEVIDNSDATLPCVPKVTLKGAKPEEDTVLET